METLRVLLNIPLVVIVWCFVSWLISRFGWHLLVADYRTHKSPSTKTYNASGIINSFSRYNHVLRVGLLPEGLYISVWTIFRIGHPPLIIPWTDITTRNNQFLWTRGVVIGKNTRMKLTMPSHLVKIIDETKKRSYA